MTFFRAFFDELRKLGSISPLLTRRDLGKSPDPDHRDMQERDDQSGEAPISWRERRKKNIFIHKRK